MCNSSYICTCWKSIWWLIADVLVKSLATKVPTQLTGNPAICFLKIRAATPALFNLLFSLGSLFIEVSVLKLLLIELFSVVFVLLIKVTGNIAVRSNLSNPINRSLEVFLYFFIL